MIYEEIKNFTKGLITAFEDHSIPAGSSSSSTNWLTVGDRIELRKGYKVLGTEQAGVGSIDGLYITQKADGTQIPFRKRGRKLEYYDSITLDWIETGTNLFPVAAVDDEVSFTNYASLAGNQMFISSPNSGIYKIMSANPGSYTDLTDAAKNFKGYIKIKQNRMFLWNRNQDKTGVYGSYIDTAVYTIISDEAITSLVGTLAFRAAGTIRTCFAIAITLTGTGELYTDNYNGVLVGSLGGTGTINYTTGAYTISNAGVGTATYQWENSNNKGVTDFTKTNPTRLAGEGFIFRQDDGGGSTMNISSFGDIEYCFHRLKSWALTITATDTNATNLIYRDNVGIPNWRASIATGDGIYFVDDYNQSDPKFRLLSISEGSIAVIPMPVSDQLKLEDYRFDKAVAIEWGDYVLFSCRHETSSINNTVFTYNKRYKAWDKLDYYVAAFEIYNGALIAADSISDNVFELLSGFDDSGSTITNLWAGNLSNHDIKTLKKTRRLWIQGEISRNQTLKFYLQTDRGASVLIGTQIGTDDNVDTTARTVIGSDAIGQGTLGGQTSTNVYNYQKEIKLTNGRYQYVKFIVSADAVGFASISTLTFFDILENMQKLPSKYRV